MLSALSNHLLPAFSPPDAQLLTCASMWPFTNSPFPPVGEVEVEVELEVMGGRVCESRESAKSEWLIESRMWRFLSEEERERRCSRFLVRDTFKESACQ